MIFWKHVKGLSSGNVYSFIRFQGAKNASDNIVDGRKITNLPQLWLNSTSNFSDTPIDDKNINCGYILTSDMTNGYIYYPFSFLNSVCWKNGENHEFNIEWDNTYNWLWSANQKIRIASNQDTLTLYAKEELDIQSEKDISISNENATSGSTITFTSKNDKITFNKQINANKIVLDGIQDSSYDGSCTATYFNATSDYRAKKDFKLLDINALELIKKVQLYSFKYKESNQPSIGIIAQDVQDININGFELVDNKEASGANFDYMSIHESKLIYILWKAIQEQQKEIEELKKLIK